MNYVYDILLNFQDFYYDFFEWEESDAIAHVKKIPVFYLSNYDYFNMKKYNIKVSNEFVSIIYNKCDLFKHYGNTKLNGAFIISNGEESLAIKVNKKGYSIAKSSLIFDESDAVSIKASNLNETKIKYSIINKNQVPAFFTRFEVRNIKENLNKLKKIFEKKEFEKINYLYLECFGYTNNDKNKMYQCLYNEIVTCGDGYNKINEFFKILEQK